MLAPRACTKVADYEHLNKGPAMQGALRDPYQNSSPVFVRLILNKLGGCIVIDLLGYVL